MERGNWQRVQTDEVEVKGFKADGKNRGNLGDRSKDVTLKITCWLASPKILADLQSAVPSRHVASVNDPGYLLAVCL